MNRRETPPGAPHPPISSGLTNSSHQLTVGQPEPLVKPASEAAHQPGQQPAAAFCPICPQAHLGYWATGHSAWRRCWELGHCGLGSAVECSAERQRAHQRQGVAPAEGRAWDTPAMGTVELGDQATGGLERSFHRTAAAGVTRHPAQTVTPGKYLSTWSYPRIRTANTVQLDVNRLGIRLWI